MTTSKLMPVDLPGDDRAQPCAPVGAPAAVPLPVHPRWVGPGLVMIALASVLLWVTVFIRTPLTEMPIYLAHILFTAGTRIALQKVLHYEGAAGHIVLGTIVGTAAPLVLYKLTERLKCTWLLGVRAAKPKPSTS